MRTPAAGAAVAGVTGANDTECFHSESGDAYFIVPDPEVAFLALRYLAVFRLRGAIGSLAYLPPYAAGTE